MRMRCCVWLYLALEQHGDTGNWHKQWRHVPVLRSRHKHRLPVWTGDDSLHSYISTAHTSISATINSVKLFSCYKNKRSHSYRAEHLMTAILHSARQSGLPWSAYSMLYIGTTQAWLACVAVIRNTAADGKMLNPGVYSWSQFVQF